MSVTVEIENPKNLRKVRSIAGVASDGKAIELALEEYVKVRKPKPTKVVKGDLPQSFWDELFAQPQLPRHRSASQAIIDERNEERF